MGKGESKMDVTELTKTAVELGIKLTNAEEGTEPYQAWADRVEYVWQLWSCPSLVRPDLSLPRLTETVNALIREASNYAV